MAVDAHNGGLEAKKETMEGRRPVVADLPYFSPGSASSEKRDPNPHHRVSDPHHWMHSIGFIR